MKERATHLICHGLMTGSRKKIMICPIMLDQAYEEKIYPLNLERENQIPSKIIGAQYDWLYIINI